MRSQGTINSVMSTNVLEFFREYNHPIIVPEGDGYEASLDKQVTVPGLTSSEKVAIVDQLIDDGQLRSGNATLPLGPGGVSQEPVSEDVIILSVAP